MLKSSIISLFLHAGSRVDGGSYIAVGCAVHYSCGCTRSVKIHTSHVTQHVSHIPTHTSILFHVTSTCRLCLSQHRPFLLLLLLLISNQNLPVTAIFSNYLFVNIPLAAISRAVSVQTPLILFYSGCSNCRFCLDFATAFDLIL